MLGRLGVVARETAATDARIRSVTIRALLWIATEFNVATHEKHLAISGFPRRTS